MSAPSRSLSWSAFRVGGQAPAAGWSLARGRSGRSRPPPPLAPAASRPVDRTGSLSPRPRSTIRDPPAASRTADRRERTSLRVSSRRVQRLPLARPRAPEPTPIGGVSHDGGTVACCVSRWFLACHTSNRTIPATPLLARIGGETNPSGVEVKLPQNPRGRSPGVRRVRGVGPSRSATSPAQDRDRDRDRERERVSCHTIRGVGGIPTHTTQRDRRR